MLIDVNQFFKQKLNRRLQSTWMLRDPFQVVDKVGHIYLISFTNLQDRNFMVEKGTWAVNNSILGSLVS